jgi:hypothetical protein
MPHPLILPTDLSGGGIALPRYRQLLADELGFYLETTVTTTATNGEARRVVLADEFRDDESGSEIVTGGGGYLYVRTGELAGSQGRLLSQSDAAYQGSRSAVVLSRPFEVPLTVGAVVAVTSPLPVKRYLTTKGLDDCVNEGLARCPAVATLTLEGTDSDRLDITDYSFLTHADQILGVYDRYGVTDGNAAYLSGLPYRIDANATTRYLVLGRRYATDEPFEVQVSLPGDRLVYDGATWGTVDDNPGLHDENDRAAVPEGWVLAFSMIAALRFLERMVWHRNGVERQARLDAVAEIRERRAQWTASAARLRVLEFPRGPARPAASMVGGTTTSTEWDGPEDLGSSPIVAVI